MNGTTTSFVPEMLNCVDASMTVLERERVRFKWQQQVQQEEEMIGYYSNLEEMGGCGCGLLGEVVTRSGFMGGSGWPHLVGCFESSNTDNICGSNNNNNNNKMDNELNCGIARTCSCPPLVPAAKRGLVVPAGVQDKMASGVGVARASSKKRKADKVVAEEESMDKVSKGFREDGESKTIDKSSNTKSRNGNNNHNNNNNKENSAETSKDNNSKVTEILKQDYIHVRARRGQATDSHSLAERVRREKISERMRYLQDLVPGCNKITGKAGMLDEIINYVQSLQRQVEFLSMKLATVNPRVDFNIDNLFAKEAFPSCSTNFPIFGISTDMANSAYVQLNPIQEPMVTFSGLDIGINHPDTGLRRTISAAVSIPEPFIESSCFSQMKQIQPLSTWDADVQNLCNVAFDQGRSASFPSQPFTGPIEAGNLKMEM